MTSFIKKASLIYILFLFTTLSGSPIQANDSSPTEGDLAFQQMKEQIAEENNRTENTQATNSSPTEVDLALQQMKEQIAEKNNRTENTFEEDISEKDPSVEIPAPEKEQSTEEKPLGITPALIEIPAIDARAEVIEVGQTADGNMEAPADIHTIGWYEPGTKPGNNGNAVMAGHVDGLSSPGTFFNLKKLEPGDLIHITGTDGTELTFSVREKKAFLPQEAPIEEIFGGSSESHLNLITCTGAFDTNSGDYEERLVVYADLITDEQ